MHGNNVLVVRDEFVHGHLHAGPCCMEVVTHEESLRREKLPRRAHLQRRLRLLVRRVEIDHSWTWQLLFIDEVIEQLEADD